MKILVTGSDGYIGTQLAQTLQNEGHIITGLDTGYYRNGWLYNGVSVVPKTITKDTRQIIESDLIGFDAVIHLAELCNDPLSQNDPQITTDINHNGTMILARASKKAGVKRFIYYSSCSVYGASDAIRDEKSLVNPLTVYAKLKVKNEVEIAKLADDNFIPTFMRNATVCGPSPRMRFDLVVNDLVRLAWSTNEIKMDSDGTPWRPLVHVLDVCKATSVIINAPHKLIFNEVFNIGDTDSNYQIKDIAEIIANVVPNCRVSLNKNGADKRNYRVNFDKIKSVLGFQCGQNVKSAAEEIYKILTITNPEKEELSSRFYIRLKQIKYLRESGQLDNKLYWRNTI